MVSLDLILLMLARRRAGRHASRRCWAPASRSRRSPRPSPRSPASRWSARTLVKRLHSGPELSLGHGKLVGQQGMVTERITGLEPGRVKLGGEIWSARALRRDPDHRAGQHRGGPGNPRSHRVRPSCTKHRVLATRTTDLKEYPMGALIVLILLVLLFLFVVTLLAKTVRIVPQARAGIVERFGKYKQTLPAGLNIVVPFIDKVRYLIDLREQVVSFPPQPVITEDNLVVSIDTVIYFQVTDPIAATYEIANYIQAVEQLTMTTLRNIVGGMDLEQTLTSREEINPACAASSTRRPASGASASTGSRSRASTRRPPSRTRWRSRCAPTGTSARRSSPPRASGSRRSSPPRATKQSAILNAEGDRESQILRAQADRESAILRAQGEGQAIQTVFQAIHDGQPDQALLAYQYLQMMPKIAEGDANKVWIVPQRDRQGPRGPRLDDARARRDPARSPAARASGSTWQLEPAKLAGSGALADAEVSKANEAVQAAIAEAASAANPRAADLGGPADPPPHRRRRRPARTTRPRLHHRRRPPRRLGVSPLEAIAIGLAGLAAGTINTVVGSGTLITFPTLLAFGVPPVTANVSNTIGLVPGSVSGCHRLPPRARRPAGPGAADRWRVPGRRPRRRASCCSCCPTTRSRRSCPALVGLGHRPGGLPAPDLSAGSRRAARRRAWLPPTR